MVSTYLFLTGRQPSCNRWQITASPPHRLYAFEITPKVILIAGPPGCEKTSLANVALSTAGFECTEIDAGYPFVLFLVMIVQKTSGLTLSIHPQYRALSNLSAMPWIWMKSNFYWKNSVIQIAWSHFLPFTATHQCSDQKNHGKNLWAFYCFRINPSE